MTNPYQELASKLVMVENRVNSLSTPQLVHSSLENGSIKGYDGDGQLSAIIGRQYDGTHAFTTVAGPPPPQPTAPVVDPEYLGFLVTWDGTYEGGQQVVAPQDFSHVSVHASTNPEHVGSILFDTKRGPDIVSARGGTVKVPAVGPGWYVWLIAWSLAGKFSLASALAGPFTAEDFNLDDFGGNEIHRGAAEPAGEQKIGNLWLAEVAPGPPAEYETRRWEGEDGWVAVRDQRVTQAIQDAFEAQSTADAANTAAIGAQGAAEAAANVAAGKTTTIRQDAQPPTTGRVVGDEWIESDNGNLRHVWSGSAWVPARIGTGAIQPNSLVARDVIATGTVSAGLLETVLVLATTIIAGDPLANHARMTASGFEVYTPSPLFGAPPYRVVSMGNATTRDTFGVADETGQLLANIDENGIISATGLHVNTDPVFMGDKLFGEILPEMPKGYVTLGQEMLSLLPAISEVGLIEVPWVVKDPGRAYEFNVGAFAVYTNNPDTEWQVNVRATTDGSAPTITSPLLFSTSGTPSMANRWQYPNIRQPWYAQNTPPGTYWRFLVTLKRQAGTGTVWIAPGSGAFVSLWIEDKGLKVPFSSTVTTGGGTRADQGSPPPPPPPAKVRYTTIWPATWVSSYMENGNFMSNAYGMAYQGPDPSGYNGRTRALIGFGDLRPTLSGATIERVEVYLYSSHWYNNAGGTAIIGGHAHSSAPNNINVAGGVAYTEVLAGGWPRAAGRWVDVTAFDPQGWTNGGRWGIVVGNQTAAQYEYYGRFLGVGGPDSPHLRITYLK